MVSLENIMDKQMNVVEYGHHRFLLSEGRIMPSETFNGLYVYDVRSSDLGFEPHSIEQRVRVNHYCSIISSQPLPVLGGPIEINPDFWCLSEGTMSPEKMLNNKSSEKVIASVWTGAGTIDVLDSPDPLFPGVLIRMQGKMLVLAEYDNESNVFNVLAWDANNHEDGPVFTQSFGALSID